MAGAPDQDKKHQRNKLNQPVKQRMDAALQHQWNIALGKSQKQIPYMKKKPQGEIDHEGEPELMGAVSYTHLTLPTILRV